MNEAWTWVDWLWIGMCAVAWGLVVLAGRHEEWWT